MGSTKRKSRPAVSTDDDIGPPTKHRSPPKRRSFFEDKLLMTHSRLGLCQNAVMLLKDIDDVQLGMMDEEDLGRKLRLSGVFRKTITDTVSKCTETMVHERSAVDDCLQVIKMCTDIQRIAEQPANIKFPFFKLPFEIRSRIYKLYFGKQNEKGRLQKLYNEFQPPPCQAMSCFLTRHRILRLIDIKLVQTCSRMRDEALTFFYANWKLSFGCTCLMSDFLLTNVIARDNVRSLTFHWRSPTANIDIPILYKCSELRHLTILISKMTTYHATNRETSMQRYFRGSNTRLCDARGVDELMKVRGLEGVCVSHAPLTVANKRTDEDAWALERLLKGLLVLEKGDDYGA